MHHDLQDRRRVAGVGQVDPDRHVLGQIERRATRKLHGRNRSGARVLGRRYRGAGREDLLEKAPPSSTTSWVRSDSCRSTSDCAAARSASTSR